MLLRYAAAGQHKDMDTNDAYRQFLRNNRFRQNRNINFIMQQCVLVGPLVALGIKLGAFPYISYKSCAAATLLLIMLSLFDTLMVKRFSHLPHTTYLGLACLEITLILMSQMHMGIYITLFLVPFISLVYCEKRVYIITSFGCLLGMLLTTALSAPFQASFRNDMGAFQWFIGQFGGYLIEYGVMFLCGLALNRMICSHFKELYDTHMEADTEKRLREQVFELSNTDVLTSIANRNAFMTALAELSSGPHRKNVTVVQLDVDGLKQVNDTLGHAAGDIVIKAAAKCIAEVFSPYGRCFRTGGDEFVALLKIPHPSPDEFEALLESSCSACTELPEGIRLTISCGFASVAEHPEYDINELLKHADKEMYARKSEHHARV